MEGLMQFLSPAVKNNQWLSPILAPKQNLGQWRTGSKESGGQKGLKVGNQGTIHPGLIARGSQSSKTVQLFRIADWRCGNSRECAGLR